MHDGAHTVANHYVVDAFSRYQKATGGVNDEETGLLRLTTAQFGKLESLFFHINGETFELTANAQAWPVRSCLHIIRERN